MTVQEVMSQVIVTDGVVISKTTGFKYSIPDFINQISSKLKWTLKQKKELEGYFVSFLKVQSDQSKHIEAVIDKYKFQFSDGVYIVNGIVLTIDEIYRLMWKEEKLLPTETDYIVENIEKISETIPLQNQIFEKIKEKGAKSDKPNSDYLNSLYEIYPNIKWQELLYNIIVPNTIPLFHIFYDDGVGGTGKSTLLEVLTMIAGENFTSNVLLDQFGNRFIFANMLGKYFNIGDDNGKNDELQNVGTLKSIITGNRVTIDRKNISPIEARIFAKQLYATNLFPYIDFTDGGIMRRLNVVPMNKVIPKSIKLCKFDYEEIGALIRIVLMAKDLEKGYNEPAITLSPLFRFFENSTKTDYDNYCAFCGKNGFRQMNIINFEVKSRFIRHFKKEKEREQEKTTKAEQEELPFDTE